jgi:DNA-binding GntR family transcriptional regulator
MIKRKPIKRQTSSMLVAEELRRMILNDELPEGTGLRQEAIAESLGVSRIPVREALKQLESEGLVTIEMHKGAVVSGLQLEEIEELFEVRTILETWLLGLAIPAATTEDFERAESLLEEMAATKGVHEWGQLNWAFHRTLYQASGRHQTLRILERIHGRLDRYVRLQISLSAGQKQADIEHRRLLSLVRKRDSARALHCLDMHIGDVWRSLQGQIERRRGAKSEGKMRRKVLSEA